METRSTDFQTARYTPEQVKAVLETIGVEIATENTTHFICYCPFHHNRHTPAFEVDKERGLWVCFNPTCRAAKGGHLVGLCRFLQPDKTEFQILRLIDKKGGETKVTLGQTLDKILNKQEEMPYLPQTKVDELVEHFWNHQPAIDYMESRGFTHDTLRTFEVGWEPELGMVVVPVHDYKGNPIGVNGRSIEGKRFKLSKRIPRNRVLFNLHRAKRNDTVIVCESQFDVMRIHQAGYPYAVAAFGSFISSEQYALLSRHFTKLIIMTDADEPGRKMGNSLAAALRGVSTYWAIYQMGTVYPHGAKDAGELSDDEIKQCIQNAIPDFQYQMYRKQLQSK